VQKDRESEEKIVEKRRFWFLVAGSCQLILVKGYFVTVIASVSQRLPCRRPGKQSFENQEIASAKSASQ
jgi:hypothetical protein